MSDSTSDVATLYKQFNKSEIIKIAKELDLTVKVSQSAKVITNAILADINKEGVPDSDNSELMDEFLYAADYIDEDGNLMEEEEEDEQTEDVDTQEDEVTLSTDQRPDCFTFADERDPSCKRCKLVRECVLARIESRPACFGQFFDERVEECKACIEAALCSQATQ